ncbi:hypothetical protein K435DRAFT_840827 [Dendrothele bispora CBS 962.96]|uniref:F-box domain-containing protein n=1 Tax=Dendrothele bispora (strain CBS 962.96) TaxID=1314807 RepID=A0A4S8LR07_DENBC|nr:hypothetical protein K435DRAFT_840827 [Dendrothele bispora CBS 962.96]
MHEALRIPEILCIILGSLAKRHLSHCASVCKQWSNVSLDIMWHEVSDLRAFFNLLAPVGVQSGRKKTGLESYTFLVDPEPKDWDRFEKNYCWRVRRLTLKIDPGEDATINSLLARVALIRSCRPILPNLTEISYTGLLDRGFNECATLFMHEGVSKACISQLEALDCHSFLQVIRSRMPLLTHLELGISPIPQNLAMVNELVAALPRLQSLIVPTFSDASPVLRALVDPAKLTSFQTFYRLRDEISSVVPLSILPHLNDLRISTRYRSLIASLQSRMSQLTIIYVLTNILESPSDVMALLSAVVQTCPNLSSLDLQCDRVPRPDDEPSRIQMKHLKPLLACSTLTEFYLEHPYALALDNKDIEEMTSHLKALEVLSLNTIVREIPKPTTSLTLEALLSFARHCPRIGTIGLFLQADMTVSTSEEILATFPSNSLQNLYRFEVGDSYINNPMAVASFLGEILPPGAEIYHHEFCTARAEWEQVDKSLPIFLEKAIQTRRRMDELKKRIRELESQIGV